jgi:hypothetical protein
VLLFNIAPKVPIRAINHKEKLNVGIGKKNTTVIVSYVMVLSFI